MTKRLLTVVLLGVLGAGVQAQVHRNPHNHPSAAIMAQERQRLMHQQQQNYAAQQRAQQRRQQAYINRMRNKKWYGAIVKVVGTSLVNYSAGYRSKRAAIREAMSSCKNRKCKVLATFANTCAMTAGPIGEQNNSQYVAFDKVGHNAIVKAVRACEAVHGGGACAFSGVRGEHKALCSGYEYGMYDG